jgi:hypothetical protein
LGCTFKFGERGKVAVDDAVSDLEKRVRELERFSGWEPGGSVPDQVDLGVCEASDESIEKSGEGFGIHYEDNDHRMIRGREEQRLFAV